MGPDTACVSICFLDNNSVSNIFILANEGVMVEMGNVIPWDLLQLVLVFVL